jgi:hypothetical protein
MYPGRNEKLFKNKETLKFATNVDIDRKELKGI